MGKEELKREKCRIPFHVGELSIWRGPIRKKTGWEGRGRTFIRGSKGPCPAVRRPPNADTTERPAASPRHGTANAAGRSQARENLSGPPPCRQACGSPARTPREPRSRSCRASRC